LIAAAAVLGVAHPTGYPTYLLLVHLFQQLPVGSLALRAHLFSAVAAIGAALCVAATVRALPGSEGRAGLVAGGVAALWFGLSPVFWSQAVVAEVYTLNALCMGLLVWWLARQHTEPPVSGWGWRGRLLLVGLALGNHITLLLPAVVWLLAELARRPPESRLWALVRGLPWLGVGLLVYLYVPLRAAAHPPINWGGADEWAGFWWLLSGAEYRGLAFGLPPEFLFERVRAWAALLVQQFGVVGLAVGFFGLLYGLDSARRFAWLSAGLTLAYSVFAITYNTADSFAYLLPAYLLFAVWIGAGLARLAALLNARRPELLPVVLGALLLFIGGSALLARQQVDASDDRRAGVFAQMVLRDAPPRALVLTLGDRDTFPLWYYHFALGQRPDMVVVARPLLDFAWYRESLRATYPALVVPEVGETPQAERVAELVAANRGEHPVCRTRALGEEEAQEIVLECAPSGQGWQTPGSSSRRTAR
jgi:hypothetical protein